MRGTHTVTQLRPPTACVTLEELRLRAPTLPSMQVADRIQTQIMLLPWGGRTSLGSQIGKDQSHQSQRPSNAQIPPTYSLLTLLDTFG